MADIKTSQYLGESIHRADGDESLADVIIAFKAALCWALVDRGIAKDDLEARTQLAPATIRAWVAEHLRLGKNAPADAQIVEALACADTMESEGRQWVGAATHYPLGMGEESRRLHREYNALEAAQRAGAKNTAEVVRLTDECAAKGIVLVPGGERL